MAYPYYTNPYSYYQQQSPTGIIWVSGVQEAQLYPVAPNNAVALWENSGKAIYLKQADATGKPTLRIYDIKERTEPAATAAPVPDVKMYDYASKDELTAIVTAVRDLTNDVEQMKGDLYGVAGRKKVKKEVVEDDA